VGKRLRGDEDEEVDVRSKKTRVSPAERGKGAEDWVDGPARQWYEINCLE